MTTRPDQTWLARAFDDDDDRYAWTRRTEARHRLALAEASLMALLVAATVAAAAGAGWTTGYAVLWMIGLLVLIPLHSLLNLGVRGLYDRSSRSLDEHQRTLRDRSHAAVGWPASGVHLAAWSGAVVLLATQGHVDLALCWGFLLWLTAGLLPYWHLAWTLPDEDEAELSRL